MSDDDIISTDRAPAPVGPYPHARRLGRLLFLSGIGPRMPGSGDVPGLEASGDGRASGYDFAAQCHAAFTNVRAVLESSGASMDDLIDVTVFLTDIERDFDLYNRVYAEYFDAASGPCRTTVEVSRLPTPIAIELKCIAQLR